MQIPTQAEVCVIGGGPAGSTIARRLALLGHQVVLIERAIFPRSHVGESLPPGILPLFDQLGIRERMEAAPFLRPDRAIIRWSAPTDNMKFQPGEPGFQVERGVFDQLLLQAAQEVGVHVIQPAQVLAPLREGDDGWQLPVRQHGSLHMLNASFVVDAAGKHAGLPSHKKRCAEPTVALYAYWREPGLQGPQTQVEAGPRAWFWGAPLPDGTFNATAFVDPKQCTAAGKIGLVDLYHSLLAESVLLRGCVNGVLHSPVQACDASSYVDEEPVTSRSIKVGEASFSIDPLSSQGVQAAMLSAIQASIVVHTILHYPDNAHAAKQFYRERQAEAVSRHHAWATQAYAEQTHFWSQPFWQRRAQHVSHLQHPTDTDPHRVESASRVPLCLEDRILLSQSATLVNMPVICGDVIVNTLALHHPSLDRPVAYLSNVQIAPLVASLRTERTVQDALASWSPFMSTDLSWRILRWLWSQTILIPAETDLLI